MAESFFWTASLLHYSYRKRRARPVMRSNYSLASAPRLFYRDAIFRVFANRPVRVSENFLQGRRAVSPSRMTAHHVEQLPPNFEGLSLQELAQVTEP
jgi:hypothetical protein